MPNGIIFNAPTEFKSRGITSGFTKSHDTLDPTSAIELKTDPVLTHVGEFETETKDFK